MKYKKIMGLLVLIIVVFSLLASVYGVFSNQGPGPYEFTSLHGQQVPIYGKGLYKNESLSMAVQAKSQDVVTLFLGIPLLLISFFVARKNSLRGRLLLTGTLGYFLYTYAVYTFVAMYNSFFLVFVGIMSASFFAFILMLMSFDLEEIKSAFNDKLPAKFIGGFLLLIGAAVVLMWLGRVGPPLINGTVPAGLEHYTTLVIQGMDLGILIPAQIIAGVLLIKREPFGYLLSSILIIKIITLLTAMSAMIVGQALAGVQMGIVEISIFPLFNIIAIYCLILILKNVKPVFQLI